MNIAGLVRLPVNTGRCGSLTSSTCVPCDALSGIPENEVLRYAQWPYEGLTQEVPSP